MVKYVRAGQTKFLRGLAIILVVATSAGHAVNAQPLQGVYQVGVGGDYATLTDAALALSSEGIAGSVTLEITEGTYREQIALPRIEGASESSTLTIRSKSGTAADVVLEFPSTTVENNYIIRLDRTSHVIIEGITFRPLGTTRARAISMERTSNISISGNVFLGGNQVIASSGNIEHLRIDDNRFEGSRFPIYLLNPRSSPGANVEITRNDIAGPGQGIWIERVGNMLIENNLISTTDFSMRILGENEVGTKSIVNNVMLSRTSAVASLGGTDYHVYHNTILATHSNTALLLSSSNVGSPGIRLINNIVSSTNGLAMHLPGSMIHVDSDHNVLYTQGPVLVQTGTNTFSDLDSYRESSGRDHGSRFADADLDLAASDTVDRITPRNPVLASAGTDLRSEVPTDFFGNLRSGTPTPGAVEFEAEVGLPMEGRYVVGVGGDYPTPAAAMVDLEVRGVSGPVLLDIESGEYEGNFSLSHVPGSGPDSRITMRSAVGHRDSVVVSHIPTRREDNYILRLFHTGYVTVEDVTFEVNGNVWRIAIELLGDSPGVTLRRNRFLSGIDRDGGGEFGEDAYIAARGGVFDDLLIEDNDFPNVRRSGTSGQPSLAGANRHAVWLMGNADAKSRNVVIAHNRATTQHGLALKYMRDFEVVSNVLSTGGMIIGSSGDAEHRSLIANNVIRKDGGDALTLGHHVHHVDIFNNTINKWYPSSNLSRGSVLRVLTRSNSIPVGVRVMNNIFLGGSYSLYVQAGLCSDLHDTIFCEESEGNPGDELDFITDYNIYYKPIQAIEWMFVTRWFDPDAQRHVTLDYQDLDAYRSASGNDQHSIEADPEIDMDWSILTGSPPCNDSRFEFERLHPDLGENRSFPRFAVPCNSDLVMNGIDVRDRVAHDVLGVPRSYPMSIGAIDASGTPVSVEPLLPEASHPFLAPAYPNPFASSTTVVFHITEPMHVNVAVYDVLGRRVEILVDAPTAAGSYQIELGRRSLAAGTYIVRLRTQSGFIQSRTVTVLR